MFWGTVLCGDWVLVWNESLNRKITSVCDPPMLVLVLPWLPQIRVWGIPLSLNTLIPHIASFFNNWKRACYQITMNWFLILWSSPCLFSKNVSTQLRWNLKRHYSRSSYHHRQNYKYCLRYSHGLTRIRDCSPLRSLLILMSNNYKKYIFPAGLNMKAVSCCSSNDASTPISWLAFHSTLDREGKERAGFQNCHLLQFQDVNEKWQLFNFNCQLFFPVNGCLLIVLTVFTH